MNGLLQLWDMLLHLVFPVWRSTKLKRAALVGIYGYSPRYHHDHDFHKVAMDAARQYGLLGRDVNILLRRLGARIGAAYCDLSNQERDYFLSHIVHCKQETSENLSKVVLPWILERLSAAAGTGLFEYTALDIQDELVLAVRDRMAQQYAADMKKAKIVGVMVA